MNTENTPDTQSKILQYPSKHILFASDLHLEFSHPNRFTRQLADYKYDALVISGDVANAPKIIDYLEELHYLLEKPIFFVLGNHDFYMCRSIAQTIAEVEQKFIDGPVVRLNEHKIIQLSETTGLIGIDGIADGRGGLGRKTSFRINDSVYIRDLCEAANEDRLFEKMEELGDQSAQALRKVLIPALEQFNTVFVVTHVPPFPEACKYNGKPNPDDSLPFFCNQVFGEELLKIAHQYPSKRIIVLSGHTHDRAFHVIENIEVHVAGAEYRYPTIEKLFDVN